MNWGYKILIVYVVFVAGILFLVYKCTTQNVDLVTEKYYDREIAYQDQYNRMENSNKEVNRIQMQYDSEKSIISILYPEIIQGKKTEGEIYFFKPDDAKLDFAVVVNPDQFGKQEISIGNLGKGLWRLQIKWTTNGVPLYQEEKIIIK